MEIKNTSVTPQDLIQAYLLNQLDPIIPFKWLDGYTSPIDKLGQVNGLSWIDSTQINKILQSLETQRLILAPETMRQEYNSYNIQIIFL
jgi:hypothetical protein